jgi:predicted nucleic acid-binding protein
VNDSRSKIVVLDSWAILAYLEGEPAAQEVRQMLRKARKQDISLLFSLINYGECLYLIEREQGLQQAQRAVGIVDQLPLHIVPVDRALVFEAARLKAQHSISFADAFCASVAKRNGARVATGDPEFKSLEPQIQIHWLPDRRKRR